MTASAEITSRIETITGMCALAEATAARSGDEGIRRLAEGLRSALDMACVRNEGEQA